MRGESRPIHISSVDRCVSFRFNSQLQTAGAEEVGHGVRNGVAAFDELFVVAVSQFREHQRRLHF
jgi:hypothetical protein